MKAKIRLNAELSKQEDQMFTETQNLDGSASRTEMLRKAVRLLQVVREKQKAGGKIVHIDNNGVQETLLIL